MSSSAPLYIFGSTSVLAAVLVLVLPETRNTVPPDTIAAGEKFCRERGGLSCCRPGRVAALPGDQQITVKV